MKGLDEYQQAALRTWKQQPQRDGILNALLGLTGEAGECADYLKKVLFHGHELDLERIKKEIGDVHYYCAVLAHELGLTLSDVAEENIAKLRARYPSGWSQEASINRKE